MAECPICFEMFPKSTLEVHASNCSGKPAKTTKPSAKRPGNNAFTSSSTSAPPSMKKAKVNNDSKPTQDAMKKAQVVSNPNVPLADLMRPKVLNDLIGQDLSEMWMTLLNATPSKLPCIVIWGPPGCGKTSIANCIKTNCQTNSTKFVKLSACTSGVADVKKAVECARNDLRLLKARTVLFIDEIHRFNKTQQDTLLPHMEDGTIILIGATTENPSFSLNSALLSRCKVLTLSKISPDDILKILKKVTIPFEIKVDEDAFEYLANICDGDARSALNNLENAIKWAGESRQNIDLNVVKTCLSRQHLKYDKKGDEHYHCASALQKSIRGSDPNAAIYWTMRMFESGEDPLFIARRLVVTASEDVGLADPNALAMAVQCMQGCQLIGRPECKYLLAQCSIYLAKAPKSVEASSAMHKAVQHIKNSPNLPPVPLHLRNATTKLDRELGYGVGYSHDPDVEQTFMPDEMVNVKFL